MMKVKQHRTADCVVGGFRYRTGSNEVGSLLLGLYDDARPARPCRLHRDHRQQGPRRTDGEARSPDRAARLHRKGAGRTEPLEHRALRRWQPLKPKLVVEVSYDQVTGNRFRHGTKLVRFRPDKRPSQCTLEQIEPPAKPAKLIAGMLKS